MKQFSSHAPSLKREKRRISFFRRIEAYDTLKRYRSLLPDAESDLARHYFALDDLEAAEIHFRRSLQERDNRSDRKSLLARIETLEMLATIYRLTDRPEQSERVLSALLSLYEILAKRQWFIYLENVAIVQWRLGNLYADTNRFEEAERCYLSALDTRSKFDDEDKYRYYPATIQCHRNLGLLYEADLSDPERAEVHYLRALDLSHELCSNPYERSNHLRSLEKNCRILAAFYEKRGVVSEQEHYETEAAQLQVEIDRIER